MEYPEQQQPFTPFQRRTVLAIIKRKKIAIRSTPDNVLIPMDTEAAVRLLCYPFALRQNQAAGGGRVPVLEAFQLVAWWFGYSHAALIAQAAAPAAPDDIERILGPILDTWARVWHNAPLWQMWSVDFLQFMDKTETSTSPDGLVDFKTIHCRVKLPMLYSFNDESSAVTLDSCALTKPMLLELQGGRVPRSHPLIGFMQDALMGLRLRVLVTDYTYVVTPHFTMPLDVFSSGGVASMANPQRALKLCVVRESVPLTLREYLRKRQEKKEGRAVLGGIMGEEVVGLVVQLLFSLEAAAYLLGFEHGNLSLDTVRVREVVGGSVYYDRVWMYKRSVDEEAIFLKHAHHGNMFVEIGDFKRAVITGHSTVLTPEHDARYDRAFRALLEELRAATGLAVLDALLAGPAYTVRGDWPTYLNDSIATSPILFSSVGASPYARDDPKKAPLLVGMLPSRAEADMIAADPERGMKRAGADSPEDATAIDAAFWKEANSHSKKRRIETRKHRRDAAERDELDDEAYARARKRGTVGERRAPAPSVSDRKRDRGRDWDEDEEAADDDDDDNNPEEAAYQRSKRARRDSYDDDDDEEARGFQHRSVGFACHACTEPAHLAEAHATGNVVHYCDTLCQQIGHGHVDASLHALPGGRLPLL